jgi:hypothetical protein
MKTKIIISCLFSCFILLSRVYCQNAINDSIVITFEVNNKLKDYFNNSINIANSFAVKTTLKKNLQLNYFSIYYNIDEEPVTGIFEYIYYSEGKQCFLTLAISLKSEHLEIEYYYFNKTIENEWRKSLKAAETEKIIICNSGTFIKQNENEYLKYPENTLCDKKSLIEKSEEIKGKQNYLPKNKTIPDFVSSKTTKEETAVEVVIAGVPNYLWYLNCGLTAETMLIGYWNDEGYSNFIPGGNSVNGHYWAFTEELCFISEVSPVDPLKYYAQAHEYGNNYSFDEKYYNSSSYDLDGLWNLYVKMIDSTQNPLEVIWMGPPYGAHATVGIGYKIDADQRFLILNDTWSNVSAYVNFDQYYESVNGFIHFYPVTKRAQVSISTTPTEENMLTSSFSLESINFNISPSLDPKTYAYHSFELADLIICNFRNNIGTSGLKIYYNNDGSFIEDSGFKPKGEWFECPNISRTFDFDKDGDLDIATTGYWSPVTIFVNDRDSIRQTPIVVDNVGRGFIDLEYGDYDLDGNIDLVSTSVDGQIRLYHNDNESFSKALTIDLKSQSYKVKFCDVNNDKYPDLIASTRAGTVVLFYNNGGHFNTTPDFSPNGHGSLSFDVTDLDNDSWPDFVTSTDGKIIAYSNKSGVFSDIPVHINDNLECYPKDILASDLNKDNYPELIIANYNRPNIILGNNLGQIEPIPVWQSVVTDPTINIREFINADGEKRLLFGKSREGTLEFYNVNPSNSNTLSVTPNIQNINYHAGNKLFNINSNTIWSVTNDAPWLTVSPTNGSGNGILNVIFTANTLSSSRVATITISGNGVSSQSLTINQEGISLTLPILTTVDISKITKTTAISGGNITSEGLSAVVARGVCWSTSENPTVDLSTKTFDGNGTGSFSSTITGLTEGATYYVRAYATNSTGTGYGNQISFKYDRSLIAYYPLLINGNDELGNNDPMTLTNTEFQNGGIYCNGIYNECVAITPSINNFNFNSFIISADFLVTENRTQPVFVCGRGCRWLGYYLNADGKLYLLFNNNKYLASNVTYSLNQWHNAQITYDGTAVNMFLDNILACSTNILLDYTVCGPYDTNIGVTNYGSGMGLIGYFKNLKIYNNALKNVLNISSNNLNIAAAANSHETFDINSNLTWIVSSSENWLSTSSTSGYGNANITLTALENTLPTTRTAFVTVSGSGVNDLIIAVIQDGISTGIDKVENGNMIILPNPTTGLIEISLKQPSESNYDIEVFKIFGDKIMSKKIFKTEKSAQIDLTEFPSGMYLLIIRSKNISYMTKIIKE